MVHIEDLGSEFDAPVETVWKFITSDQDHGTSHTNRRNLQATPDGSNAMRTSWEQNVQGQWIKVANRVALFPPVAMLVDSMEGPLAGSKFMMIYRPKGKKTGVDVVGDFQSKTVPAESLQHVVLTSLEEAFNEDNAGIRRLAGKR